MSRFETTGPRGADRLVRARHRSPLRCARRAHSSGGLVGDASAAMAFSRRADDLLGVVLTHFELEEEVLFPVLDRTMSAFSGRALALPSPVPGSGVSPVDEG